MDPATLQRMLYTALSTVAKGEFSPLTQLDVEDLAQQNFGAPSPELPRPAPPAPRPVALVPSFAPLAPGAAAKDFLAPAPPGAALDVLAQQAGALPAHGPYLQNSALALARAQAALSDGNSNPAVLHATGKTEGSVLAWQISDTGNPARAGVAGHPLCVGIVLTGANAGLAFANLTTGLRYALNQKNEHVSMVKCWWYRVKGAKVRLTSAHLNKLRRTPPANRDLARALVGGAFLPKAQAAAWAKQLTIRLNAEKEDPAACLALDAYSAKNMPRSVQPVAEPLLRNDGVAPAAKAAKKRKAPAAAAGGKKPRRAALPGPALPGPALPPRRTASAPLPLSAAHPGRLVSEWSNLLDKLNAAPLFVLLQ